MPNIKVVMASPMANIVIDIDDTVNPLSNSKRSMRGEPRPPNQPKASADAGADSDEDTPLIRMVEPIDGDG